MPVWLAWGFWISPLTYGEIGLTVNEFLAPRWEKVLFKYSALCRYSLDTKAKIQSGFFFWFISSNLEEILFGNRI